MFELVIDSLSFSGGRGVGRYEGLVVFVPDTAPGDRVRVRVTARKPRFLEAEIVQLLSDSPHRRKPPCPLAARCGGCSWQHIQYDEQVRQKEKILRDSLRRLSGFEWRPFVPAPSEFHYRNRIQLHIQNDRFGFFAKRSRQLVELEKCWIAEPAINEAIGGLKVSSLAGIKRLEVALTESGEVQTWSVSADPMAALFAQVNRVQNEVLKKLVQDLAQQPQSPAWAMDLYAGAGNLTGPLLACLPQIQVFAVELSAASVQRGKKLYPQVKWAAGDVGKVLRGLKPMVGQGVIVLDPPRPGCDQEVLDQVRRHAPSTVVYVSCNPMTFARDAERLRAGGYELRTVQGLDMFPQTEHVELIASFHLSR